MREHCSSFAYRAVIIWSKVAQRTAPPTSTKRGARSETKMAAHLDARLSYLLAQVNERQQNVLGYWNLIQHLTKNQQQHNEGEVTNKH